MQWLDKLPVVYSLNTLLLENNIYLHMKTVAYEMPVLHTVHIKVQILKTYCTPLEYTLLLLFMFWYVA